MKVLYRIARKSTQNLCYTQFQDAAVLYEIEFYFFCYKEQIWISLTTSWFSGLQFE